MADIVKEWESSPINEKHSAIIVGNIDDSLDEILNSTDVIVRARLEMFVIKRGKFQYINQKNTQPIYDLMERTYSHEWLNRVQFYQFLIEFTRTFTGIIDDPEFAVASDTVLHAEMVRNALRDYGFPYDVKTPGDGGYTGYRVVHKIWLG